MSETRTLHFDNARQLQSLYANDLKLLKSMEDSLGVKVTTREGWVKLEGEPEKIDKAQRVFNQLEEAQKNGVPIQKHEFQYALNSVSESREALGFLPGELEQKIAPYLRPLYDALRDMLEPEEIERSIARQTIEVAPLAYMRGRTLNNAFVILDEAQNTTTEQMFMLLTRIGPRSKCVITGDVTQIDLPSNKRSGVVEALQALKNVPGISIVYFNERDVVRHELVRSIITAYQQHRSPAPSARK